LEELETTSRHTEPANDDDEKSPIIKRAKTQPRSSTFAHYTNEELDKKELGILESIAKQSDLVGYTLGERLKTSYSEEISSKLQGPEGYAILDLVPTSRVWTKVQKSILLGFFWTKSNLT
jgi:hypothetical protein